MQHYLYLASRDTAETCQSPYIHSDCQQYSINDLLDWQWGGSGKWLQFPCCAPKKHTHPALTKAKNINKIDLFGLWVLFRSLAVLHACKYKQMYVGSPRSTPYANACLTMGITSVSAIQLFPFCEMFLKWTLNWNSTDAPKVCIVENILNAHFIHIKDILNIY